MYVMALVPRSKSGFRSDRLVFTSRRISMWSGSARVTVKAADNTPVGTESVRSALRAVGAVIGALGTPNAMRTVQPAPDKLNQPCLLKGRPPAAFKLPSILELKKIPLLQTGLSVAAGPSGHTGGVRI